MTTKEWLRRGNGIKKELETLAEQERDALALAASTVSPLRELAIRSGSDSQRDARLVEYADGDYVTRIRAHQAKLQRTLDEISRVIYAVEDSVLRTLLIERYIIGNKWEQIALNMDYSYSNVTHNLHPKALKSAAKAKECMEVHKEM